MPEQPGDPTAAAAGKRANRVIGNLAAQVADQAQHIAMLQAALAEAEETVDELRAKLVEVTGGTGAAAAGETAAT